MEKLSRMANKVVSPLMAIVFSFSAVPFAYASDITADIATRQATTQQEVISQQGIMVKFNDQELTFDGQGPIVQSDNVLLPINQMLT